MANSYHSLSIYVVAALGRDTMLMVRIILATILVFASAHLCFAQVSDGCRYPFVWREAFQGDHVCVVPRIRSRAAYDNAAAASRVNPANHDYGPDTCKYPFVWREARSTDHVCVTPDIRTQAAIDNAAAAGRFASGAAAMSGSRPAHFSHQVLQYNPAWQAAPGDTSCCPNNMLICPLGRHFCGQ